MGQILELVYEGGDTLRPTGEVFISLSQPGEGLASEATGREAEESGRENVGLLFILQS